MLANEMTIDAEEDKYESPKETKEKGSRAIGLRGLALSF